MLKLNFSGQIKKDLRRCKKRGYNMSKFENVVDVLRIPEKLPDKYKDHSLAGEYKGRRECHIAPDWLLIYEIFEEELFLDRTGTHSDLFR